MGIIGHKDLNTNNDYYNSNRVVYPSAPAVDQNDGITKNDNLYSKLPCQII